MTFEERFKNAASGGDGFTRVDDGPLDLHFGLDQRKPALLFRTDFEPPSLPGFASLTFSRTHSKASGKWSTLLRLERFELDEIFLQLARDLIETSVSHSEPRQAYSAFLERVRYWREMFSSGKNERLRGEVLQGLVAELLFLQRHAIPAKGARAAISAWTGPTRTKKDFRFDGLHVEVKSCALDGESVEITSLDQLEDEGAPLVLAVLPLEVRPPQGATTQSVADLVSTVRTQLGKSNSSLFDERLGIYGYDGSSDYEAIHFQAGSFTFVEVGDGFPRLTRPRVPAGIVAARYSLLLTSISQFSTTEWGGN